MSKFIKYLYYNTNIGEFIISPIKKLYDYYSPRLLPEKIYIKRTFKASLGYSLNLNNPKTFNEKIQWLQHNKRTQLHILCSDKYAVRGYVKEKIGEQYLIPLVYQTDNPLDIIPEKLPDYPFIIKTNHGCGGHIIVRDKYKIDWKNVQKKLKRLLKKNYYYKSREWQYKTINPKIVIEKLLFTKEYNIPNDYKIHCFNGRAIFIGVIYDKNINTKINYYDFDWNILEIHNFNKKGMGVNKPKVLKRMKSIAETLSNDFHYVRVDLYVVDDKIYFGELTFSPAAGFAPFNPIEWDRRFGDEIVFNNLK